MHECSSQTDLGHTIALGLVQLAGPSDVGTVAPYSHSILLYVLFGDDDAFIADSHYDNSPSSADCCNTADLTFPLPGANKVQRLPGFDSPPSSGPVDEASPTNGFSSPHLSKTISCPSDPPRDARRQATQSLPYTFHCGMIPSGAHQLDTDRWRATSRARRYGGAAACASEKRDGQTVKASNKTTKVPHSLSTSCHVFLVSLSCHALDADDDFHFRIEYCLIRRPLIRERSTHESDDRAQHIAQ